MTSILILYPDEFGCFTKFERKVLRITQDLDAFTVLFPSDNHSYIRNLFVNNEKVKLIEEKDWKTADITHAIVFDDGEVFSSEVEYLKKNNIKTREIKVAITRVINIKKETSYSNQKSTPDYEYIGRGSYWGNPYSMYEEGETREEVIRKYEYDFQFDKFPNKDKLKVYELAGKRLGCFCKPEACHGDVLANFLNSWDDGK
jgi:hypothetical protein